MFPPPPPRAHTGKMHFEPACFKQGPNRHFIPSGKAVRDLAGAETYLVWVTRGWGAVAATEIAVLVRRELTLIRGAVVLCNM